jgi:formylmethanofuran dehydrogenase subunit B
MVPDDSPSSTDRTVEHAPCLGCGCTCDDITVVVRNGRIAETRRACALGRLWFGTGDLPARITVSGTSGDATVRAAIAHAATLLRRAARPLVYLSTDVSCESQRGAIAIADVLGGTIDTITSSTARASVLTGQRRGSLTATLGEIRNRADAVVFWGLDPSGQYPRFAERYAPDPIGLYVEGGRRGRVVIAVDIGANRGPADADARTAFAIDEEVEALALMRAAILGRSLGSATPDSVAGRATKLARRMVTAKYLAVVVDGEQLPGQDAWRAEGLSRLTEVLNGPTRCALITLRGGGNRSGADAALTSQTGYPMAVDFSRGVPLYRPDDDAATRLARGDIDVALVVGSPHTVPESVRDGLAGTMCITVGPRASESPFPTACAIDTGVAGIHERGTAIRMDGIPLPLRPALEHPSAVVPLDRPGAELAVAEALAALHRPQDSAALLRALGSLVLKSSRDGADVTQVAATARPTPAPVR